MILPQLVGVINDSDPRIDPFHRFEEQDPNDHFFILRAVRLSSIPLLTALLDRGADVNSENRRGWTVLMQACHIGDLDLVKLLLSKGACARHFTTENITPLMIASQNGFVNVVAALLSNGASINEREFRTNFNALCYAIANRHVFVVQYLLDEGAYVYDHELSPLPLRIAQGQPELLALLTSVRIARQMATEGRTDFFQRAIEAAMLPGQLQCRGIFPRQWVPILSDYSRVILNSWIEACISDERIFFFVLKSGSLRRIANHQGVVSKMLTTFLVRRSPVRKLLREIKRFLDSEIERDILTTEIERNT